MSYKGKKILTVIPARGGSKGIPRKNIRFLSGKPLLSYTINNSMNSSYIDKVIVSTDDDEIAHVATIYGAEVIIRPEKLAEDDITLDPVIYHAVHEFEDKNSSHFDIIITLQPTSPLLSTKTIDNSIVQFVDTDSDTLLSVRDERHLSWTKNDNKYIPNYYERLNRQYLPPCYIETGGLLITKHQFLKKNSRFGDKIELYEVSKEESIDIDDVMDWWIAEKLLNRRKIIIRVDGYNEIGLGHIYRMLLLSNRITDHELLFVLKEDSKLGIDLIKQNNYKLLTFNDEKEFINIINNFSPNIIINDILDTQADYITFLKGKDIFVVNFKDMGEGAKEAHLVINALYSEKYPMPNHYWGKNYYCLREEFYLLLPKDYVNKKVKNILITFGGTDPHNYTARLLDIISRENLNDITITVVLGLGYPEYEKLLQKAKKIKLNVKIKQNVKNISKYMHEADIAITSAGRTVYELAYVGTPTIVLAQNIRELRHTFANPDNGIINLELGYEVSDQEILDTLTKMIFDYDLRYRCNQLMRRNNLQKGIDNVLHLIFSGYDNFSQGAEHG